MTRAMRQDTGATMEQLRIIEAEAWDRARWGWMESVRRDAGLSMTARCVAHVLALDYANRLTAECCPSVADVAAVLGTSTDTVKRAIRELVDSEWVVRKPGNGRGHNSGYAFLTRAKIIPLKGGNFAPIKGGKSAPLKGGKSALSDSQRGANLPLKGGKYAPRYYIAKPCLNHSAGATPRMVAEKLSENPGVMASAQRAVRSFREGRSDAFDGLEDFIMGHIFAAKMLTEDELAAAGFAEEGQDDD